jgi:pimeloyl-ACP methyl ester carboxylesterase
MSSISHHNARLSGVALHYVTAGDPSHLAVVLIHGYPQTWYEWRDIIPAMVEAGLYVIAPDMRGLGDSSKPLAGYDKKTVAADIGELLTEVIGLTSFAVIGHDWGGPVAFALVAAHQEKITHFGLLDVVIPGGSVDIAQDGRRWHHAFHHTPDLPEFLTAGREREYLTWFYRNFAWNQGAIDEDAIDEFARCYSKPGAMRAGFAYYRAAAQDAKDNAALIAGGLKLEMPCLALGGEKWEARGRGMEPYESLKPLCTNLVGEVVKDAGHFLVEDQPEHVAARLITFLSQKPAQSGGR